MCAPPPSLPWQIEIVTITHCMLRCKTIWAYSDAQNHLKTDPLLQSRFVFNGSDSTRSKLGLDLVSAYRWTAVCKVMVQFQA